MIFCPTFVKTLLAKKKVKLKDSENSVLEITEQIRTLRMQMSIVQSHFDLETNFDLVDSNIHQLDSLEKRYTYLIKEAKRRRQLELVVENGEVENDEVVLV